MEIKLFCPHILTQADVEAGHAEAREIGTACGVERTVEAEREGGEWFGADADGNRGMWIAPYLAVDASDVTCPLHELTKEDYEQLQAQADKACEDAIDPKQDVEWEGYNED